MGKSSPSPTLHILLLFFILCGSADSRLLVHLPTMKACKERYGFMPCSTTALGNVFLIAMYGYFMFMAAQYRSRGSHRLNQILGLRSVAARLFLPIFVVLPDSMLILVQLPQLLHPTSGRNLKVLVSLIVSVMLFVSYCLYQVFQPRIQRKRIAYATFKHVISGLLLHLKHHAPGRLLTDDGEPNREVIEKLFNSIDVNKDGHLSASELRALVTAIRFDDDISFDTDEAVRKLMKHFDTSEDSVVGREEFIQGISKWLNKAKKYQDVSKGRDHRTPKFLTNFHQHTKREHAQLGAQVQSNNVVEEQVKDPGWTSSQAILRLLLGAIVAAAFADPPVDAVEHFSDATSIPSFFISFMALPWATSSGEAVSVIIVARRKKLTATSSKTLSELYDTVTRNNVLCQSVFFVLVYARGLTWDFSGEVLVMMIVCLVMGTLASFRTSFPAWTSTLAFLLYSFSLTLFMLLNVFSLGHKT